MTNKKKKARYRVHIPTPPGISTARYITGKVFASIEYWPRLLIAVAIVIGVWRARNADLPKIVEILTKAVESSATIGWITAACVLLFSIITILFIIWWYGRELERVARERDDWQARWLGQRVQGSTD